MTQERMQSEVYKLLDQLSTLDVTNTEKVIEWLHAYGPCTDVPGVFSQSYIVRERLTQAGYKENVTVAKNSHLGEKESEALYVIGQCLWSMNNMLCIHPRLIDFCQIWLDKFATK